VQAVEGANGREIDKGEISGGGLHWLPSSPPEPRILALKSGLDILFIEFVLNLF